MQRVVVERSIAEQADGFARHRELRPVDGVSGVEAFECGGHDPLPSPFEFQLGRMVQPRPEQITSPRWLKKTLSCTMNSLSRLMNLSSARASSRMRSPGRAGML